MPLTPLELRLYFEDGAFSPAQMDQQWTDIQNFSNLLNDYIGDVETELNMLESAVGIPAVSGVATYSGAAATEIIIPFPAASEWDELQFHFNLTHTAGTADIYMQTSNDAGATWDAGGSDYGNASNSGSVILLPQMRILNSSVATSDFPAVGILTHFKKSTSGEEAKFIINGMRSRVTGSAIDRYYWRADATKTPNAIRFFCSGTALITGSIAVMKIKYPPAP